MDANSNSLEWHDILRQWLGGFFVWLPHLVLSNKTSNQTKFQLTCCELAWKTFSTLMSCPQKNVPTGDVPCCLDFCNSNMQDDMQAPNCFHTRGIRLTGFSPIHISEGRCTRRGYSTSLTSTSIARFPSSPDTSPRLGASATFAADGTLSYHEIAPESCSHKRTCWMMVSPTLTPPFPETSFPSTASLSTNMTTLSFCITVSAGSSCRHPTKTANASSSKMMVSFAPGLSKLKHISALVLLVSTSASVQYDAWHCWNLDCFFPHGKTLWELGGRHPWSVQGEISQLLLPQRIVASKRRRILLPKYQAPHLPPSSSVAWYVWHTWARSARRGLRCRKMAWSSVCSPVLGGNKQHLGALWCECMPANSLIRGRNLLPRDCLPSAALLDWTSETLSSPKSWAGTSCTLFWRTSRLQSLAMATHSAWGYSTSREVGHLLCWRPQGRCSWSPVQSRANPVNVGWLHSSLVRSFRGALYMQWWK